MSLDPVQRAPSKAPKIVPTEGREEGMFLAVTSFVDLIPSYCPSRERKRALFGSGEKIELGSRFMYIIRSAASGRFVVVKPLRGIQMDDSL